MTLLWILTVWFVLMVAALAVFHAARWWFTRP